MARRRNLIDLLDELAPGVRDAFIESMARITSSVQIAALEDAIRRGDTTAVLEIIRMDAEFFAPLDRAIRGAYEAGGDQVMAELQRMARGQGFQVSGFFGENDPAVARWLADQSSRRIVEITGDKREIIRQALEAAAERGTSPRNAALDLVGRVSKATGRREGGLIGLTEQQAGWADKALQELLDGDANYFTRKARDRRFDRTVAKAILEGRGVPVEQARRIVSRYRDGLLRYRGETIARTELLGSLHHSQAEALAQMVRRENLRPDAVTEEWDAANDSATRQSHRAMDGQKRQAGQPFVTGAGYLMRYPGDSSLGAPVKEIANCRCHVRIRVDFISGLRDRLTDEERRSALEAM